jgi:deoxyribodipyrimidine photo-lyase
MREFDRGLVWFQRDLRLTDQAALHQALRQCRQVFCVFVFDTAILEPLPRNDRRVVFIHDCVMSLDARLSRVGSKLIVLHGKPQIVIP